MGVRANLARGNGNPDAATAAQIPPAGSFAEALEGLADTQEGFGQQLADAHSAHADRRESGEGKQENKDGDANSALVQGTVAPQVAAALPILAGAVQIAIPVAIPAATAAPNEGQAADGAATPAAGQADATAVAAGLAFSGQAGAGTAQAARGTWPNGAPAFTFSQVAFSTQVAGTSDTQPAQSTDIQGLTVERVAKADLGQVAFAARIRPAVTARPLEALLGQTNTKAAAEVTLPQSPAPEVPAAAELSPQAGAQADMAGSQGQALGTPVPVAPSVETAGAVEPEQTPAATATTAGGVGMKFAAARATGVAGAAWPRAQVSAPATATAAETKVPGIAIEPAPQTRMSSAARPMEHAIAADERAASAAPKDAGASQQPVLTGLVATAEQQAGPRTTASTVLPTSGRIPPELGTKTTAKADAAATVEPRENVNASRVQPVAAPKSSQRANERPAQSQTTVSNSNSGHKTASVETESVQPAATLQSQAHGFAEVFAQSTRPEAPAVEQPVETTAPAAAAAVATPEPVTAGNGPQPLKDLSIQIASAGAEKVQLRFVQQQGELHVAVRTADSGMAHGLQQGLPELVTKLQDGGYRTETWKPADAVTPAAVKAAETQTQSNSSRQGDSGSSSGWSQQESGQRNRNQSDRPRWVEDLESSMRSGEQS